MTMSKTSSVTVILCGLAIVSSCPARASQCEDNYIIRSLAFQGYVYDIRTNTWSPDNLDNAAAMDHAAEMYESWRRDCTIQEIPVRHPRPDRTSDATD